MPRLAEISITTPLQLRGAKPDDIFGVIAFLASEDAHFVTGVDLPVDGGLSALS